MNLGICPFCNHKFGLFTIRICNNFSCHLSNRFFKIYFHDDKIRTLIIEDPKLYEYNLYLSYSDYIYLRAQNDVRNILDIKFTHDELDIYTLSYEDFISKIITTIQTFLLFQ